MRRRLLRSGASLVLVTALWGGALSGCTAARNILGTRASLCFRVLPEARAAVGKEAVFSGVRALPGSDLVRAIRLFHHARRPPEALAHVAGKMTCLVAFRGRFRVSKVAKGWAPVPGPYRGAVVAVLPSSRQVVATVLFPRIPRSIRFLHGLAFLS